MFKVRSADQSVSESADLVELSSSVLRSLLSEALGDAPAWCEQVSVERLVKMNARKIKNRMLSQWTYKRSSFTPNRRENQLILTVADLKDRNDFRKDLPSHVYCDFRDDKLIMWLDKAEEYFGIEFSRRGPLRRMMSKLRGSVVAQK